MLPTQQLSALLLRYEELRHEGQSITPEELCRDCPELVDEVRRQIAAMEQINNLLNLSTVDADDTLDSQQSFHHSTMSSIPGYDITHELARGGMGRMLAGRELALDREVAIKTLLPGSDATRFIIEAKITARLPHPSIPPVYALGTLSDGSPYLAMKLVRGQTLAEQLKARPHTLDDLPRFLQIFEQIAQAVGFAHAQGIIHRDLKPANVMVGAFGEVQVMDWGLAKDVRGTAPSPQPVLENNPHDPGATVAYANDTPAHGGDETRSGAILGTPNYMAPEQARGEVATPQSDVFALGGILCAILTGKAVFGGTTVIETVKQAAAGDTGEALSRLENCGAEVDVIALARQCLATVASDRPADGQAVAKLVAAYRQGVETRLKQAETARAEALVREAEQHKRRKQLLVAGATVLLTLLAGLGVSLWQMNRAIDAEGQAKVNERTAISERNEKELQREKAVGRLSQIEKGVDILALLLKGINPRNEVNEGEAIYKQLALRANMAADSLDGDAIADAVTVAKLQLILGCTLRELGEPAKAIEILKKAKVTMTNEFGASHERTLTTLCELASSYMLSGKIPLAITLLEKARDGYLVNQASDHPEFRAALNSLAQAYQLVGNIPQAINQFETVYQINLNTLGPNHLDTLTSKAGLAMAYQADKKVSEAVKMLEEVRISMVSTLGKEHPVTLSLCNNLASAYTEAGKFPQSIELLEMVRDTRLAKLGIDHPRTLSTLNNLAGAYMHARKLPQAIELFEKIRMIYSVKFGSDHHKTLTTINNLAGANMLSGKLKEASVLFEQAAIGVEKLNYQHEFVERIIPNTVATYENVGNFEKADDWNRKWFTLIQKKYGPDSVRYGTELANRGHRLLTHKKWTIAESTLRESLLLRERIQPEVWSTFHTQSLLGAALMEQKKFKDAEPLLVKGYMGLQQRRQSIDPLSKQRLPEALDRLIQFYTATNKPEEVKKWQAEKEKLPKPVEKKN